MISEFCHEFIHIRVFKITEYEYLAIATVGFRQSLIMYSEPNGLLISPQIYSIIEYLALSPQLVWAQFGDVS